MQSQPHTCGGRTGGAGTIREPVDGPSLHRLVELQKKVGTLHVEAVPAAPHGGRGHWKAERLAYRPFASSMQCQSIAQRLVVSDPVFAGADVVVVVISWFSSHLARQVAHPRAGRRPQMKGNTHR